MTSKHTFKLSGTYVETCACSPPCSCELTGDLEPGCIGAGALAISAGSFDGADLSGVRVAFATLPGNWVRLYVDAPSSIKRSTAQSFVKSVFAVWGEIEAVKDAKIEATGADGFYSVKVNEGKVMAFEVEPVLGGDGDGQVVHSNTLSVLSPTFKQAKKVSCVFEDGDRAFTLEDGRNAYFNDKVMSEGEL